MKAEVRSAQVTRPLGALAVVFVALALAASAFADGGRRPVADRAPGSDDFGVVQNLTDSGPGSLRAEVAAAASGGADVITFAPDLRGQITLKAAIAVGPGKLTIEGPGAAGLRISGDDRSRVFLVPAGSELKLSKLTVTHGRANPPAVTGEADGQVAEGGAILNSGTLRLDGVAVTESTALGGYSPGGHGGPAYGGGIYNLGTLTIEDSRFAGDVARGNGDHDERIGSNKRTGGAAAGGAIRNEGSLQVTGTEFSGNSAIGADGESVLVFITSVGTEGGSAFGGAIYDGRRSQLMSVFDSTFVGNSALGGSAGRGEVSRASGGDAAGGAISSLFGGDAVIQSTLTANRAALGPRQGRDAPAPRLGAGALDLRAGGISLLSDTIVANPGIADVETSAPIPTQSSIVESCAGAGLASRGYNLDVRGTCGLGSPTDQRNVGPGLGPLSDQGGPTRTMPLTPSSPAVDAGRSGEELRDQRGATRPVRASNRTLPPGGNGSDIGAYELQSVPRLHWELSPEKVTFGAVEVGTVSRFQEVTLRDDGDLPFHVGAVTIRGEDPDEFSISSQTCAGADLAAGMSCKIRVRFSPEDSGARNARLSIAAEVPGGPLEAQLLGNGLGEGRDPSPDPDPEGEAESDDDLSRRQR